jgi:hypothetical protein
MNRKSFGGGRPLSAKLQHRFGQSSRGPHPHGLTANECHGRRLKWTPSILAFKGASTVNFHDQKRRPRFTPDALLSAFDEDFEQIVFHVGGREFIVLVRYDERPITNALSALNLKSQTRGPSSTTPAKTIVAKSYRRPGKDRQNF